MLDGKTVGSGGFTKVGVEGTVEGVADDDVEDGKEGGIVPSAAVMSSTLRLSKLLPERSRNCRVVALERYTPTKRHADALSFGLLERERYERLLGRRRE